MFQGEQERKDTMGEVVIVRNKDYYDITLVNGKTMSINLAEGNRYVLGVSHKKLTKIPNYFGPNDIPSMLMAFAFDYCTTEYEEKVREYADRLISLPNYPYKVKNFIFKDILTKCNYTRNSDIDWKFYINALKDIYSKQETKEYFEKAIERGCCCNFSSFYNIITFNVQDYYPNIYHAQFLKDKRYNEFSDFIKCSKIKAFREGVKGILKREEEKQKLCDSLEKTISDFCGGMNYYEASSLIGVYVQSQENATNKIDTLINNCLACLDLKKSLGIDYQFTNIERDYQKLYIMANKNAWVKDDEYFSTKQSQAYDKLHFKDEKFETFIPTTREQLAEYGFAFNNCLNEWEWNSRLCRDPFYCVIIVSKETKTPLVCVDIVKRLSSEWRIDQYYGKSNTIISDQELLAFREAF